jgi:hypothetical protein
MDGLTLSERLRSGRCLGRSYVGFVAAVLIGLVLLAECFLVMRKSGASIDFAIDHPGQPLTDSQAEAQVLEPARQIGAIAELQRVSGGYTLMSCKNESDPPYQGAVFVTFDLPSDAHGNYQQIATAMVARGWTEGAPPNVNMPARMLSKDGVTAIFSRNSEDIRLGTLKLYGECRNIADHRKDTTAWVDITDQLH